jgi:hypothetical protein
MLDIAGARSMSVRLREAFAAAGQLLFLRRRHSDDVLSAAARRLKRDLLRIDVNSPAAVAGLDLECLTDKIIELFSDTGFERLAPGDRAWIFAQVQHLYAAVGHRSGLRIIPSAERQFRILTEEAQPHLSALCAGYDLLYFLYWCWNNSISDQRGFGANVVRPFSAAVRRGALARGASSRPVRQRPIVGLLAQFLSPTPGNALATVNRLVLRSIVASGYRATLFAWAHHDPETLADIAALGVEIHTVAQQSASYSPEDRIRAVEEAVRRVEPDVLITEMNSSLPTVLFERRVAKLQMFYQLGLPFWPLVNVDAVLDSWGVDPAILEMEPERCFLLPTPFNLPEYAKAVDQAALQAERAKFPRGRLIGCYGRISKVTASYIRTAAAIIEAIDDVTVIIGGPGDAGPVRRAVADSGCAERFVVVEGFVDGQLWGHLLDVFLDTYPQPGGLAVMEMIAKGKPTVYMEDPSVPSFSAFKLAELTARDSNSYVQIGRRLLDDAEFYARSSRATRALANGHPNEQDYANALSKAIEQCIRLGPRVSP